MQRALYDNMTRVVELMPLSTADKIRAQIWLTEQYREHVLYMACRFSETKVDIVIHHSGDAREMLTMPVVL